MPVVEKSVLIERSAEQMFDLVDKVEDYPKYMPWCSGVDVHERDEHHTVATLHINYSGIKSHFSTINEKQRPSHMNLKLRDGPFKRMDGDWKFIALSPTACKIEFRLHYEFSSRMLAMAVGPMFSYVAGTFVEAFVKRAQEVYG